MRAFFETVMNGGLKLALVAYLAIALLVGIQCKRVATISGASVKLPAAKPAPVAKAAKVVGKAPAKQAAKQPAKQPAKKTAARKPAPPPRFQEVVERLKKMKHAAPRTLKTMHSSLASFNPPFMTVSKKALILLLQTGCCRVRLFSFPAGRRYRRC